MRKGLGVFFISASVALAALALIIYIVAHAYNIEFWAAPPAEKFVRSWRADIASLTSKNKLPKQWSDIKEIRVQTDSSPAQNWVKDLVVPAQTKPNGHYRLEIFVIHWIEGYRYGVVVQHNLVDLANNNTVWEMNRTYKLGIVY